MSRRRPRSQFPRGATTSPGSQAQAAGSAAGRRPRRDAAPPGERPGRSRSEAPSKTTAASPPRESGPRSKRSLEALADLAASLAPDVLQDVTRHRIRLQTALNQALRNHPTPRPADRRFLLRCLSALARWWGWIAPLKLNRAEAQLLLAGLLDSSEIHEVALVWARRAGVDLSGLFPGGDAPNWTARAACLKRWAAKTPVNADPWLLFPDWLRDFLLVPPGDQPAKARRLAFLHAVQQPAPLWVAVRGRPPEEVWNELRAAGIKPWVHRRLTSAARLDPALELSSLRPIHAGELVVEDLASQALAKVCDPDPGERWWDATGGTGLHALHLGSLMGNKGTVVTTFEHEPQRRAAVLRLRRSPLRNITTRLWDGRHPPGKPGSFDGVLLDAPSSGIGSWRRHPDVRWTVTRTQIAELAQRQRDLLESAQTAVRRGGALIYSVATATSAETLDVVSAFLQDHRNFRLDPFPHPLEDATVEGTLVLWPHLHHSETRFIARMIRSTAD